MSVGFGLTGVGGDGARRTPASLSPDTFSSADAIPEVFNGAVMSRLSVPEVVAVGGTIEITGRVAFDCTLCPTDHEVRVIATTSDGDSRTDNVGALSGRGGAADFRILLPAPLEQKQIEVRLKAEHRDPLGGWATTDNEGPFVVNVTTAGGKVAAQLSDFAPFVVGGVALGAGGAHVLDRSRVGGGVAGAGVGVGAKVLLDQLDTLDVAFPTVPVLATAALLGAGGFVISQGRQAIPGL